MNFPVTAKRAFGSTIFFVVLHQVDVPVKILILFDGVCSSIVFCQRSNNVFAQIPSPPNCFSRHRLFPICCIVF
jgi:hypothetical protein